MKKIHNLIKIFLVVIIFTIISCDAAEDSEGDGYYNFKVISTMDSFTGYYIVDGDEVVSINNDDIVISETQYVFEKNLDNPTSINIVISGVSTSTLTLDIFVYENSNLVANTDTSSKESTETLAKSIYYTFSSDDSTDETTTK